MASFLSWFQDDTEKAEKTYFPTNYTVDYLQSSFEDKAVKLSDMLKEIDEMKDWRIKKRKFKKENSVSNTSYWQVANVLYYV